MFNDWKKMMDSLVGKWVQVVYQTTPIRLTERGTLIEYDDEGQVTIKSSSGQLRYIWPNLEIREVNAPRTKRTASRTV